MESIGSTANTSIPMESFLTYLNFKMAGPASQCLLVRKKVGFSRRSLRAYKTHYVSSISWKRASTELDSSSFCNSSMSVGSMSLPSNQSDNSEADSDGLFGKLAGRVRHASL